MSYLGELRENWRALAAAAIGLGAGLQLNSYIVSMFAPQLLQTFGWTKSSFALIGTIPLVMLVCLPLVGRLTDLFGVKRVATVGVVTLPLTFLALSQMSGDIREYFTIYFIQMILGATTSSAVYSRLVAGRLRQARGLGLALAACGPPLIGALAGPLLNNLIDTHGWRAGYQALAVFVLIVGVIALAMMPPDIPLTRHQAVSIVKPRRRAAEDYPLIARSAAFWLIGLGMFLCNLPQTLHSQQMKLMLLENGATSAAASMMISVYAVGVMIGRFACGIALDRMPTHLVAGVCMGLPALGMLLIASTLDTAAALAFAMLLIGFSQGAEGDVLAYVVVRYFGIDIYSSVLGLLTAMLSAATGLGALLLSFTLDQTNNLTLFVFMGGVVTVVGGGLLLLLGRIPPVESPTLVERAAVSQAPTAAGQGAI